MLSRDWYVVDRRKPWLARMLGTSHEVSSFQDHRGASEGKTLIYNIASLCLDMLSSLQSVWIQDVVLTAVCVCIQDVDFTAVCVCIQDFFLTAVCLYQDVVLTSVCLNTGCFHHWSVSLYKKCVPHCSVCLFTGWCPHCICMKGVFHTAVCVCLKVPHNVRCVLFQLNHFPGSFQIGRKDRLWRNLSKMRARFGKQEFSFFPRSFILPQDIRLLRRAWEDAGARQKWIIKPVRPALTPIF